MLENTGGFGFGQLKEYSEPDLQGKLTFRDEKSSDSKCVDLMIDLSPSNLTIKQTEFEVGFTPEKEHFGEIQVADLQKKPSLVFQSGRREIIYFEDPDENSEYGDLSASIQNSSRAKK
jgi:hypothetical protein